MIASISPQRTIMISPEVDSSYLEFETQTGDLGPPLLDTVVKFCPVNLPVIQTLIEGIIYALELKSHLISRYARKGLNVGTPQNATLAKRSMFLRHPAS
jgi:hypothetical protein